MLCATKTGEADDQRLIASCSNRRSLLIGKISNLGEEKPKLKPIVTAGITNGEV